VQLILLWKWLRNKIGENRNKTYDLWKFVGKNLIATGAMAISIQTYKVIWGTWFDLTTVWQVIGQIMVSLLLGGIVYYLVIKLLNVSEFNDWENKAIIRIKHIIYGKKQNS
jgi:peptidoglycan biosynthesis protein MviN/MurJ (putative lipid II flippase)